MGAFNELQGELTCPRCLNPVTTDIQFKYGSVVHRRYKLGDTLVWGSNDIGKPGRRLVILDAEGTRCPNCQYDGDWPAYVRVRDDVLTSVESATGAYDFASVHESFLVLQE